MHIKLYDHNARAYSAVVSSFVYRDRACVVHPTGTGKSFIGFKLCEDNPDKACRMDIHPEEPGCIGKAYG